MELISFLKNKNHFTDEECLIIDDTFKSQVIPKGSTVQKANSFSDQMLFIESGLLRVFYLKEGRDITHFFFDENYFIIPVNSIMNNKLERYEWVALETCVVKTINYQDFLSLGERIPKLMQVTLHFSIRMLDLFSRKLNLLQFETAIERYNTFLEMYPNLINRVSLGSTASFLGITQQTLSVIRAQK